MVEGPDAGLGVSLVLGARVVVGRGAEADLRLGDANVSRVHCAFRCEPLGVVVEDLGSRHGTFLDDARLLRARRAPEGALTRLGDTRIEVRWLGAAPEVPGYALDAVLGAGGSGVVYAGRHLASGAPVAVKVLDARADALTRRRFRREVELRSRLTHPALARILASGEAGGRSYLIRELVSGRTLEERIAADGALGWRALAPLALALAAGLGAAHAQGVVHRDVKPGNVVLGADDRSPRLIDFDLARDVAAAAERTRLTETGAGLGTLLYAAPEQLLTARDAGPPADVYGLGVTLRHALTGRPPFADVAPEAFFEAALRRGLGPLRPAPPDLPRPVADVLARAVALEPGGRYADGAAFGAALRAAAAR